MAERPSPLESTFQSLREIARDTARRLGKEVRLHLKGSATEWGASDLSRIQEALVHSLTNAIDHGIEAASERETLGKPAAGQIWISFDEENGESVVSIRDDGAGIDLSAVHRKALGLGLLASPHELALEESLELIFQPGFSTKNAVTEVSGRGVGLDIVRAVAESFSGKAGIDTTRGKGTTVFLRFPKRKHPIAA